IVAVRQVLEEMEILETPRILVWNKCDLLTPEQQHELPAEFGGLCISAGKRAGSGELTKAISGVIKVDGGPIEESIPSPVS
ncbi:MAG: hypothetical protein KDD60_06985, partial [Bdellovibrionales bacterium]|nr:hypothetical protein [Bdellovibrionales bacterium]